MHDFLCPQVLVSGTCSPVLLPCFPSIGVPVPLWLPKSTHQQKKKLLLFLCSLASASGTHSLVLPPCFPSILDSTHALCLLSVLNPGAGCSAFLSSLSLPADSSPPARGWGEGCLGPARLGLVSYPLREVLGSRRCGCGLAVVVCPLVSILGRVVFVIFSWIYVVLGGDFRCSTHAAILAPPLRLIFRENVLL